MQMVALFVHLEVKYLERPSTHQHGVSRFPQNIDAVAPKRLFEHAIDLFVFQLPTFHKCTRRLRSRLFWVSTYSFGIIVCVG